MVKIWPQSHPGDTIPPTGYRILTTVIELQDDPHGIVHVTPHASILRPTMVMPSLLVDVCDPQGNTSEHLMKKLMEVIIIYYLNPMTRQPSMQSKHGILERLDHMGNNHSIWVILCSLWLFLILLSTLNHHNLRDLLSS